MTPPRRRPRDAADRPAVTRAAPPAARRSTYPIRFSSRSASPAGLSVRIRAMRGKRSATPDLWREESCAASKITSSTSVFSTSRTGPNRPTVWLRIQRSSQPSSSSV